MAKTVVEDCYKLTVHVLMLIRRLDGGEVCDGLVVNRKQGT